MTADPATAVALTPVAETAGVALGALGRTVDVAAGFGDRVGLGVGERLGLGAWVAVAVGLAIELGPPVVDGPLLQPITRQTANGTAIARINGIMRA